jgi:16S rRNA (guanine(966)-N(2))-methyltransferase RsmD
VRIIAGDLKGRRLSTPRWDGLRPTSDRLRETLFNVLAPVIRGARVLDGYAGTGAVGIEALSRGAAHVTFVEADARACRLIADNLRACAVEDRHVIIRAGFADAVRRRLGDLDLVFLDPPYGADALLAALDLAAPLVGPEGRLVIEHAARDSAPDHRAGLQLTRRLQSGDSALAFYHRGDAAGEDSTR